MTAKELLNNALNILGYTAQNGNEQLTRRIMNKAVSTANIVYSDLWEIENGGDFEGITSLSDEIKLTGRALSAFPYGLAAFIAQSENDGDSQQLWITMYNRKRAGLTKTSRIKDTLPRSCDL